MISHPNKDFTNSTIILKDVHCPYCGDDNAFLINEKTTSVIGLRLPAFGLKFVLSLIYLSIVHIWIYGCKLIEVTKERTYVTYGFCPKCGNSYSAGAPEEVKNESEDPKLYKVRNGKAITGLCKGISEYTGIPVLWVRIMTVLYSFTIIGAFLYFLIAACIPTKEDAENGLTDKKFYKAKDGKVIMGLCKGFSEYTDIPVVWVRILTVILGLTVIGTILYFILGAVAHTKDDENAK